MKVLGISPYYSKNLQIFPSNLGELTIPRDIILHLEPPSDFLEVYLKLLGLRNRYTKRYLYLEHPEGWQPYRSQSGLLVRKDVPELSVKLNEDYFVMGLNEIGRPLIPHSIEVTEEDDETYKDGIMALTEIGYIIKQVSGTIPKESRKVRSGVTQTLGSTQVLALERMAESDIQRDLTIWVGGTALPSDIVSFLDVVKVVINDYKVVIND